MCTCLSREVNLSVLPEAARTHPSRRMERAALISGLSLSRSTDEWTYALNWNSRRELRALFLANESEETSVVVSFSSFFLSSDRARAGHNTMYVV